MFQATLANVSATSDLVAGFGGQRNSVEIDGGGYGMGLTYARDMIHPSAITRIGSSRRMIRMTGLYRRNACRNQLSDFTT